MLRRNRGFTLIELLVVMALIIVLLSLAVAVSNSSTMDSYKVIGAGDRLSQALITAKSRAARDRAPRGIRLVADAQGFLQELYYIEQPEPWLPSQREALMFSGAVAPPNVVPVPVEYHRSQLAVMYPKNLLPETTPPSYRKPIPDLCRVYLVLNNYHDPIDSSAPVQTDYERFVQMFVPGQVHVASSPDLTAAFAFASYTDVTSNTATTLNYGADAALNLKVLELGVTKILNPDLACGESPTPPAGSPRTATFQSRNFGIYLPAKPLAGEPSLVLSRSVAVDPQASLPNYVMTAGQSIDVLFSPSGHVMYYSEGVIAFLIRDTTKFVPAAPTPAGGNWLTDPAVGLPNFRGAGEMVLVAIFPKTGTVVTQPVAEPGGANPDPYQFAKNAINTGL